MKSFSIPTWRPLALLGSTVIATFGTAGCHSTPLAMPLHDPRPVEQTAAAAPAPAGSTATPDSHAPATPPAGSHTQNMPVAAGNAGNTAGNTANAQTASSADAPHLSWDTPAATAPQPAQTEAAGTSSAPQVSRPITPIPATIAAPQSTVVADSTAPRADTQPSGEPSAADTAHDPFLEAATANDWSATGTDGDSSDTDPPTPIQLTGHQVESAPAPPRMVAADQQPAPPGQAASQPAARGQTKQAGCDDCLPGISEWQEQLQQQTDALSKKVEQLEEQLEKSRQALETVNAALKESNRELSRLSNDVRFWQGEVKRIEAVMERQHQQDIESLDALSATLEQLIRDEYRTSRKPAANEQK